MSLISCFRYRSVFPIIHFCMSCVFLCRWRTCPTQRLCSSIRNARTRSAAAGDGPPSLQPREEAAGIFRIKTSLVFSKPRPFHFMSRLACELLALHPCQDEMEDFSIQLMSNKISKLDMNLTSSLFKISLVIFTANELKFPPVERVKCSTFR